jgi:hypothetical protein
LGKTPVVVVHDPDHLVDGFHWADLDARVVPPGAYWHQGVARTRATLVTDLPGLAASAAAEARSLGFSNLVHLCIDGADRYDADLLVNASPGPLPVTPAAVTVVHGPAYAIIRPDLVPLRPSGPWSRTRARRALVSMGATDAYNATVPTARTLMDAGFEVTALAGPGISHDRARAWEQEGLSCVSVVGAVEQAELLTAHDLVVTPGGVTTWEAMFLGVPVACIDPGPQGWFSRNLCDAGLATMLPDTALEVRELLVPLRLATTAAAAFDIIDGGGGRRTIAAIEEGESA